MENFRHAGLEDDNVGLSGALWGGVPLQEILGGNPELGRVIYKTFDNAPTIATTVTVDGIYAYVDGSCSVAPDADDPGVVELTTTNSANNEVHIAASVANAAPFAAISSSSPKTVIFEARVNLSSVADVAAVVGLAEPGFAANSGLADTTGAIADKDFVGFQVLAAAPTAWDAIYHKAGQTQVQVLAAAHTQAASTYVKLGFRYNAVSGDLDYYVNGAWVATVSDVSVTAFPDGELLAPIFGVKTFASAAKVLRVDWFCTVVLL